MSFEQDLSSQLIDDPDDDPDIPQPQINSKSCDVMLNINASKDASLLNMDQCGNKQQQLKSKSLFVNSQHCDVINCCHSQYIIEQDTILYQDNTILFIKISQKLTDKDNQCKFNKIFERDTCTKCAKCGICYYKYVDDTNTNVLKCPCCQSVSCFKCETSLSLFNRDKNNDYFCSECQYGKCKLLGMMIELKWIKFVGRVLLFVIGLIGILISSLVMVLIKSWIQSFERFQEKVNNLENGIQVFIYGLIYFAQTLLEWVVVLIIMMIPWYVQQCWELVKDWYDEIIG